VGGIGQRRLLEATALFSELPPAAGAALMYLAAAGVGTIAVEDERPVDAADVGDLGWPRRVAAAARAAALNPVVSVVARGPGRPVAVADDREDPLFAGACAAAAWVREVIAA
jgi:molybdopterin/thiamine biosynthesis adenylyltransferase